MSCKQENVVEERQDVDNDVQDGISDKLRSLAIGTGPVAAP